MAVTVRDISPRDTLPDERPWVRRLVWIVAILLLLAGGAFLAYKLGLYGSARSRRALADASLNKVVVMADFVTRPAQLDKSMVDNSILNAELGIFAAKTFPGPEAGDPPIFNYRRLQDPQDNDVLRDLANDLTTHQNERFKAWIKSIRAIRRETIHTQENGEAKVVEWIHIDAEFREPFAFIQQGDAYYLVEKVSVVNGQKQSVVLPGRYYAAQRKLMADFPCVSGLDEPLPEPGAAITAPDAIAGLELAAALGKQPYARQIATINVSNFNGRRNPDPTASFITLDTIFPNAEAPGTPTRVLWGRPIGEESFFEVHSPAKLANLSLLFVRYNRIDAAAPRVNLRFDQPKIPMARNPPRSAAEDAQPVRRV